MSEIKKKKELQSFSDSKQPNHYIRELMINEDRNYRDRKYILIYTRQYTTQSPICFIGKTRINAFIKFYDFLNTEKCLCPFDRHTTCLELFLDEHIFKGKEFSTSDVNKFNLKTLKSNLIDKLIDAYCDLGLFEGELIGTYRIFEAES